MKHMNKIYGIDFSKVITPLMVRDALGECFYEAHCQQAEIGEKDVNRDYCHSIVRKAFKDSEGDYEKPTKESIIKAMEHLEKFAKNFRDQNVVKKHAEQIMKLVNKL